MKIRNDFVSNSSSSSFIVLHSENKYGVLFDEERMHVLTFKEYIERFGELDLFDWRTYCAYDEVHPVFKYVSVPEFAKLFKEGKHEYVLPVSVQILNEELLKSISDRFERDKAQNGKSRFDKTECAALEKERMLENDIADQIYRDLLPYFENETFDYVEIDDHWDPALEEKYGQDVQCKETLIRNRIQYLCDKIPVTFYRIFCNH